MAQLKEKWTGRGKATIFEDDSIEFRPDGKGQPVQRDVRKSGRSKFYQTNGEKESNYVAHLSAPVASIDPVGDMLKDFDNLTRELQPQLLSTRRSTACASLRRSCSTLTKTPTALPTGHTL